MLLVIDVGNTNIVIGVYDGEELIRHWRLSTQRHRTSDEYGMLLKQLFSFDQQQISSIEGAMISCVVPPMLPILTAMIQSHFGVEALVVGPGVKTGMPILYENPREVGADRIVNAVAAFAQTGNATVVVDFGTATTFDAINDNGAYMGGAITPGVVISSEALFMRASKLPRVEILRPERVIGRNTETSIQAGLAFGYVSLVDGMVDKIVAEYGSPMSVISTGGLGGLFEGMSDRIERHEPNLTLMGLRLLFERNQRRERSG